MGRNSRGSGLAQRVNEPTRKLIDQLPADSFRARLEAWRLAQRVSEPTRELIDPVPADSFRARLDAWRFRVAGWDTRQVQALVVLLFATALGVAVPLIAVRGQLEAERGN